MSKFDPKPYLIKLGGKDYLQVAYRVQWFRTEHPAGRIETDVVNMEPLLVKAAVYDADGHMLATGHGGADAGARKVVWSGREFEKAETAAIGRALAHAGYGTQFTGEDEGEHLADSPLEHPAQNGRTFKKAVPPPLPGKPDALVQEGEALGGKRNPVELPPANWVTSNGNPDKFYNWTAATHGLNDAQTDEALGCAVRFFSGTKQAAIDLILAYIAKNVPAPK
jgi:hypothetical protein